MNVVRIYASNNQLLRGLLENVELGLSYDTRIEYCTYETDKGFSYKMYDDAIKKTVNITRDKIWVTANHDLNPDDEYSVFLNDIISCVLPKNVLEAINRKCVKSVKLIIDDDYFSPEEMQEMINSVKNSCNNPTKVSSEFSKTSSRDPDFLKIFGIKDEPFRMNGVILQDCYLRGDYVKNVSTQNGVEIEPASKKTADYVRYFSLLSSGRNRVLVDVNKEKEFQSIVPTSISNLDLRRITEIFGKISCGKLKDVSTYKFETPVFEKPITYALLYRHNYNLKNIM